MSGIDVSLPSLRITVTKACKKEECGILPLSNDEYKDNKCRIRVGKNVL